MSFLRRFLAWFRGGNCGGSNKDVDEDAQIGRRPPKKAKLLPVIVWLPEPINYPQPIGENQLNALCYYYQRTQLPGALVYTPLDGTGTMFSTDFVSTPHKDVMMFSCDAVLPAGWHTLTVLFIPLVTDVYQNVEHSIQFEVRKGLPDLQWDFPEDHIEFTTLLDISYFQCKCTNTEGDIHYSHEVDVLLERGTHKIVAQFIPNDRNNWATRSISKTIFVAGLPVRLIWDGTLFTSPYPTPINRFHARARCADPSIEGTFRVSPPFGTVLPVGSHTVRVDFSPVDSRKYNVAHICSTLVIDRGYPTIQWWKPFSLYIGESLSEFSLNATSTDVSEGTFEYDPPHGTILPLGTHSITATFTPKNLGSYHVVSRSVNIEVLEKGTTMIEWEDPAELEYPARLTLKELNAVVIPKCRGKFIYTPPEGSTLDVGVHELRVQFIPDSLRTTIGCEKTVQISVAKTKPLLSWANPRPVFFDEIRNAGIVSETQLNCLSNIPGGEFQYAPALGAELPRGIHELKATFYPTDSNTYDPADCVVNVKVVSPPKRTPILQWAALNSICYPKPLRLKEELICRSSESHGAMVYDPPAGSILSVGEHVLKLTFFTFRNNNFVEQGSTSTTITVLKAPAYMKWEPGLKVITYGTPLSERILNAQYWIVAEGTEEIRRIKGEFVYSPPVGTILDAGLHTLHCKFVPEDKDNVNGCEITVQIDILRAVPTVVWSNPSEDVPMEHFEPLNELFFCPLVLPVSEHVPAPTGKYTFSRKLGDILAVGSHDFTCRFYPDDIINYYSADGKCTILVEKGTPSLRWLNEDMDVDIEYGNPLREEHFASECITPECTGRWVFKPPPGTIVEAAHEFEISAKFIPDDTSKYRSKSLYRALNVVPFVVTLSWALPDHNLTYGQKLSAHELCATVNISGPNSEFHWKNLEGGVIEYSPPIGTVVVAGRKMFLSADFILPNQCTSNYKAKRCVVFIDIAKANPPIVWKPPRQPIEYFTPLPASYLCASTPIAGKFVYHPALGSILDLGRNRVDCKFIPEDGRNYSEIHLSREISITKGTPKVRWRPPPIVIEIGQKLTADFFNAELLYPPSLSGGFNYSM
jgi:hypothetical protein